MRNLLLALLGPGPAHGYDLKRAYDQLVAGAWPPINIGQIYATMARLERDGLVAHTAVTQDDRPDKKVYELTPLGAKELDEWLAETSDAPAVKSDVALKLLAARLTGLARPQALISAQRNRYLLALRELQSIDVHEPFARLLAEAAVLHLEAELRWLERCLEVLEARSTP